MAYRSARRPGFVLASVMLILGLSACGESGSPGESDSASDPGPVHVHGLGLNPADDALFIATHTGLFRAPEGEDEAKRVVDTFQDTMGFTVTGPNEFLGSGHPDLQQNLPPYLGLIRSRDAGKSWEPVSLEGDADFHVLEAAGERIYGFGSDFQSRQQQFLASDDGGDSWDALEPPDTLISLAINPRDPDELVASGQDALYASANAGQSWESIPGEPGLLSWPDDGDLYLLSAAGRLSAAEEAGAGWDQRGEVGGEPAAFEAGDPQRLFAALHDGAIVESEDGGATWTQRTSP
jgi:hypothetical protein